jgi:hypothetical protein
MRRSSACALVALLVVAGCSGGSDGPTDLPDPGEPVDLDCVGGCPAGLVCDTDRNVCVTIPPAPECTSDAQCGARGPCDPLTHACACAPGTHRCGTQCLSNSSPDSCDDRCTPCPGASRAPEAVPICEAWTCNYECPEGQFQCFDGCCTATQVVAGMFHTCVLTNEGGVVCWGSDQFGQTGDGRADDGARPRPMDVVGLASGVAEIAAGYGYTCARLETGALKCWGENFSGELGIGSVDQDRHPEPLDVKAVTGFTPTRLAFGTASTMSCAVGTGGTLWCWGSYYAEPGVPASQAASPTLWTTRREPIADAMANGDHGAILAAGGTVSYWRDSGNHRSGLMTVTSGAYTALSGASAVFAGAYSGCALADAGTWCWGSDGKATRDDALAGAKHVAIATHHGCATLETGGVRCWGVGTSGQLGNGTVTTSDVPVDVVDLPRPASAVAVGSSHSCALLASGAVMCWGANWSGELGIGSSGSSGFARPKPISRR